MPARSAVFLLALAVLSGCMARGDIGGAPAPASTTTSPTTTSTTVPTTTATTQTGTPVGWVAPSGVTLAVTAVRGGVVEVLTPCGHPAEIDEGTPIYEVDVVIDAGHGGDDTGAIASSGLMEKTVNMEVSQALHEELTLRGVDAVLTRTGDYVLPIRTRARYADLMGAEALVSIHHNAPQAPASEIPGVEIFVQQASMESQRLGGLLYEATMTALAEFAVDWVRAPDAGVMIVVNGDGEDAYGMVRRPETPSALVELGYIANPAEAALYAMPEYAPTAATAMADALESFLGSDETGAALVEGRVFNPRPGVGQDECVEPDLGVGG